jgi:hypothetical protein
MQVTALIASFVIVSQPRLAQFGDCRVYVKAGAVPSAAVASVKYAGKTVWSRKCESDLVATYGGPAGGNFLVLSPPTGLAVFRRNGRVLKDIAFSAARDPRPFIYGGRFAVWGEGIFNWHKLDKEDLCWQNRTRRFFAVDLRTGHSKRLLSYRKLGLPLAINGNGLIAVTPVDWDAALAHRKTRRFWIRSIDLSDDRSRKAVVNLSESAGRRLLLDIIGWDDWKETVSTFDERSGRLTIASLHERRHPLTIEIPKYLRGAKSP